MNALFAPYAWNTSLVDGTNIICFAAKARTFHFPLNIQIKEDKVARIPQEGRSALQHIEMMLPLWWRQKEANQQRTQGMTPRKRQQKQNEMKLPTRQYHDRPHKLTQTWQKENRQN
jgi:hypothetical protein